MFYNFTITDKNTLSQKMGLAVVEEKTVDFYSEKIGKQEIIGRGKYINVSRFLHLKCNKPGQQYER